MKNRLGNLLKNGIVNSLLGRNVEVRYMLNDKLIKVEGAANGNIEVK